jgi:hypothetical protein
MTDFDDIRLNKSTGGREEPPSGRRGPWIAVVAALVAVAAAFAVYLLFPERPQAPPASTTPDSSTARQEPLPTVAGEPGEDVDLPPLGETDPLLRQMVQRLSSHPRVASWLTTQGLVRNFTVVTVNIANGRTPATHLRAVAPSATFRTRGPEDHLVLDARSYTRYDEYADAVAGLDARGTARLYATLKPRIEEAYRELGEPEESFDVVLERAIRELLRVPVVEEDVRLQAKPLSYAYADPRLESLSPAQKHLLRMGPRNVRLIQAKLREVASYLGIPESRLPPPAD